MMTTKKAAIVEALRQGSLNRFQAERLGDHCLNSTISELRAEGYLIHAYDELVMTRFGRNVRVKRYCLLSEPGGRA